MSNMVPQVKMVTGAVWVRVAVTVSVASSPKRRFAGLMAIDACIEGGVDIVRR